MINRLGVYARLAAYVNGAVGLLGAALLFTFFAVGQPFGTLNDMTALPWAVAMVPILFALFDFTRTRASTARVFGLIAGLMGLLGVFVFQTFLVLGLMTFSQELPYVNASYALIGVWFLVFHRLAHPSPIAPRGLASFGLGIGIAWVLGAILAWMGGWPTFVDGSAFDFSDMSPITLVGLTLFSLGYLLEPIWALWLGRTLRSGRVFPPHAGRRPMPDTGDSNSSIPGGSL